MIRSGLSRRAAVSALLDEIRKLIPDYSEDDLARLRGLGWLDSKLIRGQRMYHEDLTASLLKANPKLKLSVEGHTDNTGTPEGNRKLSDARAASVKAALVAKGIEAPRLQSKGFGQDKPVADNRTEEGRAKNRRVELVKL